MKGRILFVCVGAEGGFFSHRMYTRLARLFDEAMWSCMPVFLGSAHDGHIDIAPLVHQIAEGVRFAVVLACERQVMDLLGRSGVPYVVLNGYARDFPGAVGVIRDDTSKCYADLIGVLRDRQAPWLRPPQPEPWHQRLRLDMDAELRRRRVLSRRGLRDPNNGDSFLEFNCLSLEGV